MTACRFCGSTELSHDDGASVCTSCGKVNEESNITSDVAFAEGGDGSASVIGQFVSDVGLGQGRAPRSVGGQRQHREVTLANGRRRIMHLASALKLSGIHVDAAFRFFMLAVQNNFTQGRRTPNVVAACLYLVCRRHKTPHMLIDFSDVLQANLFVLGNTFFRLCRLLRMQPPLIDPSLYIHRFAAALNLGDLENDVATTALRLVQRMKRDWMQIGRRPAGICGAALYIAARIHRVQVDKQLILTTIKVCDMTLRRRVGEFQKTHAATQTMQQFLESNPEHKGEPEDDLTDETSENPPAYTQARRREAEEEQKRHFLETRAAAKRERAKAATSAEAHEQQVEEGGSEEQQRAAMPPSVFGETTGDEDDEDAKAIEAATELLGEEAVAEAQANAKKRKAEGKNKGSMGPPVAKRGAPPGAPATSNGKKTAANKNPEAKEMDEQFQDLLEAENAGDMDGDKYSNYGIGVEEQMEKALTEESGQFKGATPDSINRPALPASHAAGAPNAGGSAGAVAENEVFDASDIPDEDVEQYLNSEEQYEVKKLLWDELNKEYIEEQAEKERIAAEQAATGVVPKKRTRKAKTAEERAAEAAAPKERSSRINWDALKAARTRTTGGSVPGKRHALEGNENDDDEEEEDDFDAIPEVPVRPPPSAFLGSLRPTIPSKQNQTQSTQATQAYDDEDEDDEEEEDERPKTDFRSQVFGAADEDEEDYAY